MAKIVDKMHLDEMKVLRAAYYLCRHASRDYRDNTVRSIQIRGVLDNVFEMICTDKRVPEEVCIEGIQYAIDVLSDPNICKLVCNKYDMTDPEPFDSNYGDFGRNDVRANIAGMLKTGPQDAIRKLAYKLVAAIAMCPRFYVRAVDQNDINLDVMANAIKEGLVSGCEHPASFGEFCLAVYRLSQHTRIRNALMRQSNLIDACHTAIASLLDEVSPDGSAALSRMFQCLCLLVMDLKPTEAELAKCDEIGELVNQVLSSGSAAETRRWARAAASALRMLKLRDQPRQLFETACQHFLEHYEGLFNKTDEFGPTPELINDPDKLLSLFNGNEWFDAPQLFFAGAFHCLGRAVAAKPGDEVYTKYKEKGGFDMMVRHRSLPDLVRKPLKEMTHFELYVMLGIWSLGLSIMPDNRDTVIRYIQMPNIIDHSVEMIREPNKYPGVARVLSMQVMCMVCEKQDICRMVCNRVDFPEFMMKLFSEPITVEDSEIIEELQYKLFRQLVQCPKLAHRLSEESHFEKVIAGIEELILTGWERPLMFRRLLECACILVSNVSLQARQWERQSMLESVNQAVGMLVTMADGVPDEAASVNLIKLAELLLKKQRNEDLLGAVQMVKDLDYLPQACRDRANRCFEEVTYRD